MWAVLKVLDFFGQTFVNCLLGANSPYVEINDILAIGFQ
jgi:hypothetical protein